jgi:hypothetical protein
MTRITIPIATFILALVTSCTSCKDKNCPDYLLYRLPAALYPQKDTFNIGDTLWVDMNFHEDIVDEIGSIKNTFNNYDFLNRVCLCKN